MRAKQDGPKGSAKRHGAIVDGHLGLPSLPNAAHAEQAKKLDKAKDAQDPKNLQFADPTVYETARTLPTIAGFCRLRDCDKVKDRYDDGDKVKGEP